MLLDLIQTALSGGEIRWLLISFLLIFLYSKLVVSRRLDIEIVAIVKEAEQQE